MMLWRVPGSALIQDQVRERNDVVSSRGLMGRNGVGLVNRKMRVLGLVALFCPFFSADYYKEEFRRDFRLILASNYQRLRWVPSNIHHPFPSLYKGGMGRRPALCS
jgi:hypothetical protein